MLVVAVIALVMPALYVLSTGIRTGLALQEMSLGIAGMLLVAYSLGLLFSLRTHRDIFNPVTEVVERPRWAPRFAVGVLVVSTGLVAIESELLVGSLEAARKSLGLTDLFVAPILVFVSLLSPRLMTLDFEIFELASLALSTAVVAAVVSDGRSNWYEGALLVIVYAVMAVAFLFHPP
jgi:Ca2+:H+ antiporter